MFVLFVCLTVTEFTFGQQLAISGAVSDGTGVVPGATVTLRDPAGTTSEIKTNNVGQYQFDGLRAGAYEITVSREGFTPATRAFTLAGEARRINFTLQVSGLSTTVDVN